MSLFDIFYTYGYYLALIIQIFAIASLIYVIRKCMVMFIYPIYEWLNEIRLKKPLSDSILTTAQIEEDIEKLINQEITNKTIDFNSDHLEISN